MAASEFERITYTEAVALLEKSGKTFEFPTHWGVDLQSEHERYLTEEVLQEAGDRHRLSEGDQGLLHARQRRRQDGGGHGRARCRASARSSAAASARSATTCCWSASARQHGLKEEAYWWYLDLRRFGGVAHAGFGLGFERMMMYLTGMKNIRDVIPFPRTPGNAEY